MSVQQSSSHYAAIIFLCEVLTCDSKKKSEATFRCKCSRMLEKKCTVKLLCLWHTECRIWTEDINEVSIIWRGGSYIIPPVNPLRSIIIFKSAENPITCHRFSSLIIARASPLGGMGGEGRHKRWYQTIFRRNLGDIYFGLVSPVVRFGLSQPLKRSFDLKCYSNGTRAKSFGDK